MLNLKSYLVTNNKYINKSLCNLKTNTKYKYMLNKIHKNKKHNLDLLTDQSIIRAILWHFDIQYVWPYVCGIVEMTD